MELGLITYLFVKGFSQTDNKHTQTVFREPLTVATEFAKFCKRLHLYLARHWSQVRIILGSEELNAFAILKLQASLSTPLSFLLLPTTFYKKIQYTRLYHPGGSK